MEKVNKLIVTGIITAITASLCCVTPVLALVAGVSGFASSFSWLEPVRPYFIGLTILVLAFAWHQKIKPKEKRDCNCETGKNQKFIRSKMFLSIITVFTVLMLAFPSFLPVFYPTTSKHVIMTNKSNVMNAEFKINGMTCEACEKHINYEVNKLSGIIKISTSFQKGIAIVEFDKYKTNIIEIEKAINETGYQVIRKKEN